MPLVNVLLIHSFHTISRSHTLSPLLAMQELSVLICCQRIKGSLVVDNSSTIKHETSVFLWKPIGRDPVSAHLATWVHTLLRTHSMLLSICLSIILINLPTNLFFKGAICFNIPSLSPTQDLSIYSQETKKSAKDWWRLLLFGSYREKFVL